MLNDHHLDKFSRISQSATLENPAGDAGKYIAFGKIEGRLEPRLVIRRVADVSYALPFAQLQNIVFNDAGEEFELWYPFMQVRVKGRNLTPIIEALITHRCAFIRDYDARQWPIPLKEKQPVIEKINILGTDELEQKKYEIRRVGESKVLELDKAETLERGGGHDNSRGR